MIRLALAVLAVVAAYAATALLDARDAKAQPEPQPATFIHNDGTAIWRCPREQVGPCEFVAFIAPTQGA